MDMIFTKCGMDVGNMLIFSPEFAHIFSVQHIVRSAHIFFTCSVSNCGKRFERRFWKKKMSLQDKEMSPLGWGILNR